jgi:hypothetical protein
LIEELEGAVEVVDVEVGSKRGREARWSAGDEAVNRYCC